MSDTSPAKDTEAKLMPPPSAVPFKKPSALPTKKVTPKKPAVVEKKDEAIPIRPEGYGLIEEQDHEEEHQESNTNNTNAVPAPDETKPNPPQERPSSIPIDVYQPPFWSAPATGFNYTLEVLRDGAIIDNIDLHSDQKSFYVFGRLPICDIVLDHQTISRYHAVIQFRQNGDAYLYDLGSTHGTFVNKIQIKPKAYLKIKNGYHIKFGQSSRSYIVGGGPDEEKQQEDAEELKKRIMQVQEAYKNAKPKGKDNPDEPDEGEIQNMEDETEFFSSKKMKEENKKKISDFKRRLGDDDDDEFGLKKNAKKPTKKGEEEEPDEDEGEYLRMMRENEEMFKEFYGDDDDDQDEFYDRTKKKNKNSGVETYETLIAKQKYLTNQKAIIEREIEKLQRASGGSGANDEGDSLDSFMASIGTSLEQEKIDKKKVSLKEVEDELARIKPLIAVAKPAIELQKPKVQQQQKSESDSKKRKIDEVASTNNDNQTDDNDETPVKKPKTEPKSPSPAPAPKPKLANVFEEKEAETSAKIKRGPVQGPTLDFLQQIKTDASSPSVKNTDMDYNEDNDNNTSGSNKKKESKSKIEPEISYEEWRPPEGQKGDGRTSLNDKYGY